jgi:hypothetical protein
MIPALDRLLLYGIICPTMQLQRVLKARAVYVHLMTNSIDWISLLDLQAAKRAPTSHDLAHFVHFLFSRLHQALSKAPIYLHCIAICAQASHLAHKDPLLRDLLALLP